MDFSSLKGLVAENKDIKAVFVGGKGGVGKTSCACSLALQFSLNHTNKKVLLISTDPAHNVSDAFVQQFNGEPNIVNGSSNLYACEVDPAAAMKTELEYFTVSNEVGTEESTSNGYSELENFITNLPGIDEAMAISSLINYFDEDSMSEDMFDIVVFDTAPTGHTLRLLQLPALLKLGLEKLTSWKAKFASLFTTVSSVFYADENKKVQQEKVKRLEERMQVWLSAATKLSNMFKDNLRTQFVCVCNASFLSVYETKRLVNELKIAQIKVEYIIVNMLMPTKLADFGTTETCEKISRILEDNSITAESASLVSQAVLLCGGLGRMQSHYLGILREGNEMKIVGLPLLNGEIRGINNLTSFSERMITIDANLSGKTEAKFTRMDFEIKQDKEYIAETGARLMSKDLFKDSEEFTEHSSKPKEAPVLQNITPEMIALVQGMIMKPGGLEELLNHPIVTSSRHLEENSDLNEFLTDIESNGLMAGFKYLNNVSVMNKLAEIAKKIKL